MEDNDILITEVDVLFEKVTALIDDARKRIKTAVNLSMVYTYYGIGQYIIEDEQQGKFRAAYGKRVLETLSERLTNEGNVIEKPADLIKNPLTLEFLGLKPEAAYTETKLEAVIIDKMQEFLLELGCSRSQRSTTPSSFPPPQKSGRIFVCPYSLKSLPLGR